MKYFIICFFLISCVAFSQEKATTHTVTKDDTILKISTKYNITPYDLYQLNPDIKNGIQENMVLVVSKNGTKSVNSKPVNTTKIGQKHEVKTKETLFSLSKLYDVEIADIEKANPEIVNKTLSIGQILIIPTKKSVKNPIVEKKPAVYHEVKPKETKYSIAKQYQTTIQELERLNPEIITDFPIGFKLLISGEKAKIIVPTVITPSAPILITETIYIVKPKETLYSLCNQFGVIQEELITLNPELKNGLKEGMSLKIPVKTVMVNVKKEFKDLTKSFKIGTKKKLALLLPFNIEKLDQDTINSTKSRLKKDKFLNMTLDFYAGALIAIDSVKKMGMNVTVSILDSNETKSTSNITSLIRNENLKSMDAIIGPFFQNNAEKTAELLQDVNVPVISPLSRDFEKNYSNLLQATPSTNDIRKAMFDFMKEKSGNIVAIVDPKKVATKTYLTANYPELQYALFSEKGSLNTEQLKSLFVKDKINYVLLETEKTNLIFSATNALISSLANFDIKLVVFGENDALDYEEIQLSRLAKLKMHYPSVTRVNDTEEATIFENAFRRKNKILPNQFATRGFDVTFDTLMRLAQTETFNETILTTASEQIENKFNYTANPLGGYTNQGVYILNYETDLTIKVAK